MNLKMTSVRLAAVNSFMMLQMVHWVTPLWKATTYSSLAASFVYFTLWAYSANSLNCNGAMEYISKQIADTCKYKVV